MRFGVNSLLFTDTFVEKDLALFDHVRRLGFDTFEITPVEPDRFPAAKVRQIANDLGMTVNVNFALGAETNPASPDPAVRTKSIETSKKVIDLCNEAGVEIYCGANYCAWNYFTGKRRTDDEWQWAVESYRTICAYAAETSNLILGVETLNRFESYFINTAAEALRFVEEVGLPNATVHLDTFHMLKEEDNVAAAIRHCGSRMSYFHACGSQRGIPGRDVVPWQETFEALLAIGYDSCITIESFNPRLEKIAKLTSIWRDFADSPEQLATEGLKFVKRMYQEVYGVPNDASPVQIGSAARNGVLAAV